MTPVPETADVAARRAGPAKGDVPVAVVSLFRREEKIQPRSVTGRFARWRWAMVWATQLVFYGLPWMTWNGRPAVLFDLAARRFFIGPLVLYPQDFIYLTALLVLSALSLFLFTAVAGRLWCGFACPQTVYTEVFMWVERRFEGDRLARLRLDAAPWSARKLLRKGGKQAAWLAIGLWTGFTFVGYFTPVHLLSREVLAGLGLLAGPGLGPWEAFWVLFYGFATYGNAGYMREQVCKYMCPYARFQSAMFDKDTLIVSYDAARGDPRGSRPRSADPRLLGKGDCVDCTLCVQVCPTGIDIRDGLQYECIGCAACVDACDGVMGKMGYAPGLIRFDTQNAMAGRLSRAQTLRRVLRPRVLAYGALLLALSAAFLASLATRAPFRVDVVRDRGAMARLVEDGRVENVYRLQLMNAREEAVRYRVSVQGLQGARVTSKAEVDVNPTEGRWLPVNVQLDAQAAQRLSPGAHPLVFSVQAEPLPGGAWRGGVEEGGEVREKSTFIVPR